MLTRLLRVPIRISAFLRKEVFEILRQPRLVATLVLGPFLILLLFGIGYRAQGQPLRTLFVMERTSPFRAYLEEYATSISPLLVFSGITDDLALAQQQLLRDEVDIVIELPENPYETVRSSNQASFTLYHNEINPVQVDYIRVFGQVYVDEVNRRVLSTIMAQGQQEGQTVEEAVGAARVSATAMREALEREDVEAAQGHRQDLNRDVGLVSAALGASAGVLANIQQTFGGQESGDGNDVAELLRQIQEGTSTIPELESGQSDYSAEIQQIAQTEAQLAEMESNLEDFRSIEPRVLVSPFFSETESVARLTPELADFYAPAVIALLIQHIAITFAGLSIVSERLGGTMELFRVSPLSPLEALLGKYLSYLIFEVILAALLTGLVVLVLGTPMLGSWLDYALVVLLLIVTSLSAGFVFSLLADTTSQAVQYAMIVLLTSIFFSGFFLTLELLWEPVRIVSYLLPVTYAIQLLQDIMLRGGAIDPLLLLNLAVIGLALFVLAWFLMRRRMSEVI